MFRHLLKRPWVGTIQNRYYTSTLPETLKTIRETDLVYFQSILPPAGILTTNLSKYNTDWLDQYHGSSTLVLRPTSSHQVSQILSYCDQERIGVVPQGGNTGLVGGSVPVQNEIVLSMELMNKVVDLDKVSGIVTVESGCILETLDLWLRERGYIMPLGITISYRSRSKRNLSDWW
jgi:FAD/FMN-containing dehydrogenase